MLKKDKNLTRAGAHTLTFKWIFPGSSSNPSLAAPEGPLTGFERLPLGGGLIGPPGALGVGEEGPLATWAARGL